MSKMKIRSPSRDTPADPKPVGSPIVTQDVKPQQVSEVNAVNAFIAKIKTLPPVIAEGRGRLIFAMDATMSRQPSWDMALSLQSGMFDAVREAGGLDVQLVYFRGASECKSSTWKSNAEDLARVMRQVNCEGGQTQIERVLIHAATEAREKRVNALVFVGDAVEEARVALAQRAGELALLGVPVFLFQEGRNPSVAATFETIARVTRGAACRFDAGSAQQLRDLLSAVAVYAAGGQAALKKLSAGPNGRQAQLMLTQMQGPRAPDSASRAKDSAPGAKDSATRAKDKGS